MREWAVFLVLGLLCVFLALSLSGCGGCVLADTNRNCRLIDVTLPI